ncbi:MAG: hypothetical protein IIC71_12100 [Acidobacteria bacterium]|nr:hypothetical protein [Acidobacteriota bacterium]
MISLDDKRAMATKAFYAAIGAPVVAVRLLSEYSDKMMEAGNKLTGAAKSQFETLAEEGEKFASELRSSDMADDIQEFVSVDQIQDTVGKLREQLESALTSWRETFNPDGPVKVKTTRAKTAKPAATKTATRKPATKAKATRPATKTSTARSTSKATAKKTASRPAAKKAANKTAKKTPAAKASANKTTSKKTVSK